jgi:hypothetical protein
VVRFYTPLPFVSQQRLTSVLLITPAACAALEWRRSRNGKDVAVPAMVMCRTYFSWKAQSKFVDRAFTPLTGAP